MDDWQPATHWLVKWPGQPSVVMTDDEFMEFVDRVKYDEIEYEAEVCRREPK